MEADAILLAEYRIIEQKIEAIPEPPTYDNNMIRMGQLFVRTTQLIWDCLVTCGLERVIVRSLKQIAFLFKNTYI